MGVGGQSHAPADLPPGKSPAYFDIKYQIITKEALKK
jgi:hypothetical protein